MFNFAYPSSSPSGLGKEAMGEKLASVQKSLDILSASMWEPVNVVKGGIAATSIILKA